MISESERIVLTKWSPPLAAGVLLVTASLWAVPLYRLLTGDHTTSARIGLAVPAAVLAIPFLWTLWRVPKTLRGMGIEIDHAGVHPFDGKRTDTITWPEIAGIGFGSYSGRFRGIKTKTLPALEIFLKHADLVANHRRLRGDWQEVPPPADGYSAGCFRYTVSPYGKDGERVEAAVRRHHPELWSGPFLHEKPR